MTPAWTGQDDDADQRPVARLYTPMPAVLHILAYEDLRLTAYDDGVGKMTIGWGHLIRLPDEIHLLHREITRGQANALFLADLGERELRLNGWLFREEIQLAEHQFGALMAFLFNIGWTAFVNSTLAGCLRTGHFAQVPAELKRWIYGTVKGKKQALRGLQLRREDEARLWEGK